MADRIPILLSFYAISNGTEALIFGQVTATRLNDLSFIDFSRRRTFRTLISLYRTKPLAGKAISLEFNSLSIKTTTDASGFFLLKHRVDSIHSILQKIVLGTGEEIRMVDGVYSRAIHYVDTPYLIISDIDDTILHSYISRKLLKLRTLLFTPVEKRRAVDHMKDLIKSFAAKGATAIYLSNSEQNLYPLIYRFLQLNGFPPGPLFLKQLRRLRDVFRYRRIPTPEVHKMKMLDEIIPLFPDKKFVLIGDNTQYDLSIYTEAAGKYASNIRHIIIRKVISHAKDEARIAEMTEKFSKAGIAFYYSKEFPALAL